MSNNSSQNLRQSAIKQEKMIENCKLTKNSVTLNPPQPSSYVSSVDSGGNLLNPCNLLTNTFTFLYIHSLFHSILFPERMKEQINKNRDLCVKLSPIRRRKVPFHLWTFILFQITCRSFILQELMKKCRKAVVRRKFSLIHGLPSQTNCTSTTTQEQNSNKRTYKIGTRPFNYKYSVYDQTISSRSIFCSSAFSFYQHGLFNLVYLQLLCLVPECLSHGPRTLQQPRTTTKLSSHQFTILYWNSQKLLCVLSFFVSLKTNRELECTVSMTSWER